MNKNNVYFNKIGGFYSVLTIFNQISPIKPHQHAFRITCMVDYFHLYDGCKGVVMK